MTTSPNRMVAIATPLVFAPLAGAVTALAAKYAPGLDIDQGQLEAIFIAGATIAFAKSGLWLKGWQDYEKREQAAQAAVGHGAEDPYAEVGPYLDVDDVDDIDEEAVVDAFDMDLFDADEVDVDELDSDVGEDIEDDERDDVLVAQAG